MKKNLIIIALILLIIIVICITGIKINSKANRSVLKQNFEYEQYLKSEIYGTDVITLINKAISNNEENQVAKDEKGIYINNNKNSINIDIIMITNEEKLETTTYKMETIAKVGINEFIKNFSKVKFKCTNIKYHSAGKRIAYMEISQLAEE